MPTAQPPQLVTVANSRTFSVNFNTRKEEYVTCWFHASEPGFKREDLRLEIGEFGVPALYVRPDENGSWMANFRLPPGLRPGWAPVRLRFADSQWGAGTLRIAVDMPLRVDTLVLKGACDGATWNAGEVAAGGYPQLLGHADCRRTATAPTSRVYLGDTRLHVDFIGEPDAAGARQVNAAVPAGFPKGEYPCRAECAGVSTGAHILRVT